MSQASNHSVVQPMRDNQAGPANLFAPSAGSHPRDKAFKLAELGFLQIVPVARTLRGTLFFTSVGFAGDAEEKLHDVYRKHHISGFGLGPGVMPEEGPASMEGQIERTSGVPASARLDCLSLLGCAASVHILEMVGRGTFRPCFIHCADKDSFADWSRIRATLVGRGYLGVGELEGAEMLIDGPRFDAPDSRPSIASFDVFDTLIARRCVEPWRIFEKVGELAGLDDFVRQRREAEGRVIEGTYVFDDIYDELARHYEWSPERRREIQALELECERTAVIPIAENMTQVRDGDLLVSDMYLSEEAIRGLLAEAGLTANVGLYVESHGKSSGRVWPLIDSQFAITQHLGDNPHADVAVPARLGLATTLTRASDLNLVERTLLQSGLRDLALMCREARLRTWHDEPALRTLQIIQTSLNMPLLLMASVVLARRAETLGKTRLAFCSRDCNLWLPLFNRVQARMGLHLDTTYFLTSRIARTTGSDAYLRYAQEQMGPDAMVVDLCGTGWSMAHLAERLDLSASDLFLIDHCPPLDAFERKKATPKTCTVHRLFEKRPNANNILLELTNMAEHGMVADMRAVGSAMVPVLELNPLSLAESLAVQEQRRCFLASLDLLEHYALDDVFDLDDASLSFLCASLYEYMSKQADCFQMFAQRFLEENADIVRTLTR